MAYSSLWSCDTLQLHFRFGKLNKYPFLRVKQSIKQLVAHATLSKLLLIKKKLKYINYLSPSNSPHRQSYCSGGPWSSVHYLWQLAGAALHGGMEKEQPGHELQTAESRDNFRINCCFRNTHPCYLLDFRHRGSRN